MVGTALSKVHLCAVVCVLYWGMWRRGYFQRKRPMPLLIDLVEVNAIT